MESGKEEASSLKEELTDAAEEDTDKKADDERKNTEEKTEDGQSIPKESTSLNDKKKNNVAQMPKENTPPETNATAKELPIKKTKKEKITRQPTLEKVEEFIREDEPPKASKCPDYFGVRSYLHYFYEAGFKDPSVYEDDEDDTQYLLRPRNRRRRCRSVWWKSFTWIGAALLIIGLTGILVGYLVKRKPLIIGTDETTAVVDKDAVFFNFNLDVVKLVGLVMFCIGGGTLAISLLVPSFLYNYCEDGKDESFKVRIGDEERPLGSPLERLIPANALWSNVQPNRKAGESVVCQEGIVKVH